MSGRSVVNESGRSPGVSRQMGRETILLIERG